MTRISRWSKYRQMVCDRASLCGRPWRYPDGIDAAVVRGEAGCGGDQPRRHAFGVGIVWRAVEDGGDLLQNGVKVDAVTVKVAKDGELGLLRTPVKAAVYAEVSRMLSTPPTKRIITVRVRPVTSREATTIRATTG